MSTVIPLPWYRPPISGNRERNNVHAYAAKVREARDAAFVAIRAAKIEPRTRANVTLHYRVPDHRRRDADNLSSVFKVCQDALVAANVLPDDSWQHVPQAACRIHPPTSEGPAMWVTLEEVA